MCELIILEQLCQPPYAGMHASKIVMRSYCLREYSNDSLKANKSKTEAFTETVRRGCRKMEEDTVIFELDVICGAPFLANKSTCDQATLYASVLRNYSNYGQPVRF